MITNIIEKETQQQDPTFTMTPLHMGVPGLPTPPLIAQAQKDAIDKGVTNQYSPFTGRTRLTTAASTYFSKVFNTPLTPECCLPIMGAMHGLYITLATIAQQEHAKLLIITPSFSVNFTQAERLRLPYTTLDIKQHDTYLRGEQLISALKQKIQEEHITALLWSSPNNPSWFILTDKEYKEMARLADKHNITLIHDAAYLTMDYDNTTYPTPLTHTKNAVTIISASKILSYAGERVGLLCAQPSFFEQTINNQTRREHLIKELYSTTASVNSSTQEALAAAFEAHNKGVFRIEEHVQPYKERGKKTQQLFLKAGFDVVYQDPTYHDEELKARP